MNPTKISYSFAPGMQKITLQDQKNAKRQINEILGNKNRQDFCRKKRGIVNIPKHLYDSITSVFEGYGIAEADVWSIVNV